jgi:hypothetical protein
MSCNNFLEKLLFAGVNPLPQILSVASTGTALTLTTAGSTVKPIPALNYSTGGTYVMKLFEEVLVLCYTLLQAEARVDFASKRNGGKCEN